MTNQKGVSAPSQQKFGLTFHRSFSLVRPAITSVLQLAAEYVATFGEEKTLSLEEIRKNTNLGTIYVEAMPRYAKATGLVDDLLHLTAFGSLAYRWDPLLERSATQWLMHYHISAPFGMGPAFWNHLVVNRFRSGNTFTREEISRQIADFISESEGRIVNLRDADTTATVFLGTYTKSDGLGNLEILEERDDRYLVLEPEAPPIWAMAYALLDFWMASFPQQITVNLNELTGANGLTGLFLVGTGRLNAVLRAMQDEGYVEVHRVAPPYQVVLLNPDRQSILERLYSHE